MTKHKLEANSLEIHFQEKSVFMEDEDGNLAYTNISFIKEVKDVPNKRLKKKKKEQ